MQRFPRLTQLFGKPVEALDEEAITTAIQNKVLEARDLDWKSQHYEATDKGRFELAKDVAQLANTGGGIIVLGVAEVRGAASAPTHVELGDHHQRRMNQILSTWIDPFLPGIRYVPIEVERGKGFLVIGVPQSVDAPHAVQRRDLNVPFALAYPVRDGTNTRWLSEYEIAARYRDRYQSRAATRQRLEDVHAQGLSRIQLHVCPWLAVSLVPSIAGSRGVGSDALDAEKQFLDSWRTRYECPETSPFWSPPRILAGIRRAIITDMAEYAGSSRRPHAELHYSGEGFAATNYVSWAGDGESATPYNSGYAPAVDNIAQDALEIQIMFEVLLLAHHAASTGASGECYVLAQLMLRQQTDPSSRLVTPGLMYEPVSIWSSGLCTNYATVELSIRVEKRQPLAVESSASIEELTSDIGAVVRTSYGLAADILAEFAIAEPIILRPDGSLRVEKLYKSRRQWMEPWASRNL